MLASRIWRTVCRACLALPVGVWVLVSYILAGLLAGPLMLLGQLTERLYWALPFVPCIWPYNGPLRGHLMSLVFRWHGCAHQPPKSICTATPAFNRAIRHCRYFYCMNVARRAITLPLRRTLPTFYIAGFPVWHLAAK